MGRDKVTVLHQTGIDENLDRDRNQQLKMPYSVDVAIEGVSMLLYHRYDPDSVESRAGAKKGSKEKKTDDVESCVYRVPETHELALPAVAIKESICNAAKFAQDPRSPRKSARDLYRASIIVSPDLIPTGKATWDGMDRRGVRVQQNRVTRLRPFLDKGWKVDFVIDVLEPEYIQPAWLQEQVERAGRLVGLLDFRPDFGRFRVTRFETKKLE